MKLYRPTKEQLEAAREKTVADVMAKNLKVLFCGINPGLYTAAIGHHFGRPGNRFWPTLHNAGFTPTLLNPYEEQKLLAMGYGITNLVARTTARADELTKEAFVKGRYKLEEKVLLYKPTWVAFVGLGAYRDGFKKPHAQLGEQKETIGATRLWVLPSTSGLNAFYNTKRLGVLFRELYTISCSPHDVRLL